LADECVRYRGEKLFDLLNGGGTASVDSPTYDQAAFFGSSRTIGDSGTFDNTLAADGDDSAVHFRVDLQAARAAMMAFKVARGRPINRAPNVILIHPAQSSYAWEALNVGAGSPEAPVITAGMDGLAMWAARGYTVIESAYLTDTAGKYFMHVSSGAAPFILQEEFTPQLEGITTPNTESGVIHERFIYKARDCFAVGYGDPRLCIFTT
jgi:phage major head subunit gpT-like protein